MTLRTFAESAHFVPLAKLLASGPSEIPLVLSSLAAACADAGGSIDISLDNLIYGSRFRKKTYHMGSSHRVPTAVDLIFESITLFNLHIILTP